MPEDIYPVESDDRLNFHNGFDIRPLPGGCPMTFGPHDDRTL